MLFRSMRPSEELFDLKADPQCTNNLAASPDQATRLTKMQQAMTAELQSQGDPRALGNGQIFESYPVATPSARNFYERMLNGEKVKAGWVNETDFEKEPLK